MDVFRHNNFYKIIKNNQLGQSTVEYILLFAIISVLVMTVFKSEKFESLFGENGKFSDVYKREIEFSYRHGLSGRTPFETPNYNGNQHESYRTKGGESRFFGAKNAYPR